jgi:hypothetical protein
MQTVNKTQSVLFSFCSINILAKAPVQLGFAVPVGLYRKQYHAEQTVKLSMKNVNAHVAAKGGLSVISVN